MRLVVEAVGLVIYTKSMMSAASAATALLMFTYTVLNAVVQIAPFFNWLSTVTRHGSSNLALSYIKSVKSDAIEKPT